MNKFKIILISLIIILLSSCKTAPVNDQSASSLCQKNELYHDSGMNKREFDEVLKLAQSNNPCAQNEVGRRYGVGEGIGKDPEQSIYWYKKAASEGLAISQANLAYMYFRGEGTSKDLELARKWFLKSAEQGHFEGQRMLGYMYITGTGVAKDGKEAEKWYLLAANQGHVSSQYSLQHMYSTGNGVEKDQDKAIMWLHRVRDARLFGKVWKKK